VIITLGTGWFFKPVRNLFTLNKKVIRYGELIADNKPSKISFQLPHKKKPQPEEKPQNRFPSQQTTTDSIKIPKDIPKVLDIRGEEWLLNSHINIYLFRLQSTHPKLYVPTFFEGTLNRLVAFSEELDFKKIPSEKRIIVWPLINSGNHWTLVVIDRDKRSIAYYDSKKDYGDHKKIVRFLQELTVNLTQKDPGVNPYTFSCTVQQSIQPDSYQCGAWILYFSKKVLEDPAFDVNAIDRNSAQQMIANFRLHVQEEILALGKKP
jgi:Ulp1 family protease